jgi:hypothetical protein
LIDRSVEPLMIGMSVVASVPLSKMEEDTMGDFLKGLLVAAVAFALFTLPATWLLMLFFGNLGMEMSYIATLPLGTLVSVLLGGVTSRTW